MPTQGVLANTLSGEVDDFKGSIEHGDKGGLETIPVLDYDGSEVVDDRLTSQRTMPQCGWTAIWCLVATSGTLSIRCVSDPGRVGSYLY